MKPGDRVIWLRSPRRSFLTGWRVQRVPAILVRICACRARIMIRVDGIQKMITVDMDNLMCDEKEAEPVQARDGNSSR